jgi:hypothetical protein
VRELELTFEERQLERGVEHVAADAPPAGIVVRPAPEGAVLLEPAEEARHVPVAHVPQQHEVLERGDPRKLPVVPRDEVVAPEPAQVEEALDCIGVPARERRHRQVQAGVRLP